MPSVSRQTWQERMQFSVSGKRNAIQKAFLLTVSEITFSLVKEKVLYQRRAIFKWNASLIKMLRFTCHKRSTGSIIQHDCIYIGESN